MEKQSRIDKVTAEHLVHISRQRSIDNFREQTERLTKVYKDTDMLLYKPCVEIYMGIGRDCTLGQNWESLFYEPNYKLLLL